MYVCVCGGIVAFETHAMSFNERMACDYQNIYVWVDTLL